MPTPETQLWFDDTTKTDYLDGLRAALETRKMSRSQLAEAAGCSPSYMSYLLNYGGPVSKRIWRAARERLSYPGPMPVQEGSSDEFWYLRDF